MNVNMFRRAAVVAIAVMVSQGASLYMTAGGGGSVHPENQIGLKRYGRAATYPVASDGWGVETAEVIFA